MSEQPLPERPPEELGNSSMSELQQTAVVPALDESPLARNGAAVRLGPELHLSVEHAAIARGLPLKDLVLVLALGRGLDNKAMARQLGVKPTTIAARIEALRQKTRMSRLSLAVLGYQLLGQPDYQDLAA